MKKFFTAIALAMLIANPAFAQSHNPGDETAWSGSAMNRYELSHGYYPVDSGDATVSSPPAFAAQDSRHDRALYDYSPGYAGTQSNNGGAFEDAQHGAGIGSQR
jgi:hypothetical protein